LASCQDFSSLEVFSIFLEIQRFFSEALKKKLEKRNRMDRVQLPESEEVFL